MFFEALQAYYAPSVILVFFAFILATDKLLTLREKKLFLVEIGIVALMILTTWAERTGKVTKLLMVCWLSW